MVVRKQGRHGACAGKTVERKGDRLVACVPTTDWVDASARRAKRRDRNEA